MADYRYGFNCIVAKIKSSQEVDIKFVLNRKQYTVTYNEHEHFDGIRNLSQLLLASNALKASMWNVPAGPPGSNTRSWYVTDIWNPNITGMEKTRLPEPTISIVCRVSHLLGQDYFICDVGKQFTNDVIVLHRSLLHYVSKGIDPVIGNYLLVFTLVVWEEINDIRISRFVPLWAYWDSSKCTLDSTAYLNIVERGPENSTLLIPHQVPCMWGVVQSVSKKSLKVYVPCITSSVNVPKNAIYQCDTEILREDWIQLWLTPQTKQAKRFSEVTNWTCNNCCWFGKAKKRYEAYLQKRLNGHYVMHSSQSLVDSGAAIPNNAQGITPKPTEKPLSTSEPDVVMEIGVGVVKEVKERSGKLLCKKAECKLEHVFHLGIMTIYGVKMLPIKGARLQDFVGKGSQLRYRMNVSKNALRAVWIGPEHTSFKNYNILSQLSNWLAQKKLSGMVVQEMMKSIMESIEAAKKEMVEEAEGSLITPKVTPANSVGGTSTTKAVNVQESTKEEVPQRGPGFDIEDEGLISGFEDAKYTKEEEEELERLWWSEDSEDTEDDLMPVPGPNGVLLPSNDGEGDDKGGKEEEVGKSSQSLEKANQGGRLDFGGLQPQPEMVGKKQGILMVVLMELSRFLMEKGLSGTVADACGISADFVSRLDKALEGSLSDGKADTQPLTQSIGTQTDAYPIISQEHALLISQFLKIYNAPKN
ncbi:uncharacterized protein [Hetaerina americana]|uniref:uncharacterized protein isoform X2 n=1 Tax=Hetaerina americana TaxID=62018 RepID=UPI003A7F5003